MSQQSVTNSPAVVRDHAVETSPVAGQVAASRALTGTVILLREPGFPVLDLSRVSDASETVVAGAEILGSPHSWYARRGKRLFDFAVSLLIAAPAILVVLLAATILVLSGESRPFFFQERVGKGGRTFRMLKLRTMSDADPDQDARPDGGVLGLAEPNRITAVGRVLRASSIDEVPQVWNVLVGDMSLVGPRPEVAEIAEHTNTLDHPRNLVRPGITGRWQTSVDRSLPLHLCLHHDTIYIERLSFRKDLGLLARTVLAVFRRTGV